MHTHTIPQVTTRIPRARTGNSTGAVLGEIRITKSVELPVDWSYGEGEDAKPGDQAAMDQLIAHNVIR